MMTDKRVGALITAAGMSTRMGDFKPLLKLGPYSMIRQIVNNFIKADVTDIFVVTGYKSNEIMESLCDCNITFVYNEKYEETQMLDSVKLGLDVIRKRRIDKVLFCPCDVAAFKAETINTLLKSEGLIVVPEYVENDSKDCSCTAADNSAWKCTATGHPICIDTTIIPAILSYEGGEGLRGALNNTGIKICKVKVSDEGILLDADTKEDYEKMKIISR